MKKGYLLLLFSGITFLTSCFQSTTKESSARTELAGIYEKTDVAATEKAKATPTMIPTPLGKSSGNILHTTSKADEDTGDIFITNLDTLEKVQLTHNSNEKTSYHSPIASHNGEKIAYVLYKDNGATYYGKPFWKGEIFIMDIDGENPEKISNIQMFVGQQQIDDFLSEDLPTWSPDDKKLAFSSNRNALIENFNIDEDEIYVIDLETYDIQQLTKAKGLSTHPSWSPDGEYITFMSNRDGDWDIYYMKSDGSGKDIKITINTSTDRFPSWSNDGNKIVYHSDRDGNLNLYVYNFETEEESKLTNHPADDATANWSPDDSWVVFSSDRDGDHEIYIMNVNTKEEIKITDNQVSDAFQNWIP
jgi:Tol biopolymer transport system component